MGSISGTTITELHRRFHASIKREPLSKSTALWPSKRKLLNVDISIASYQDCINCILAAARSHRPALVTAFDSRAVVVASDDPELSKQINQFELVAPDGAPVKVALNWLYRAGLAERVSGPDLTRHLCEAAAREGLRVYFFGASQATVCNLVDRMTADYPQLRIAGHEEGIYRPMSAAETEAFSERVRRSGAEILFLGLGNPRQEAFAFANKDTIDAVQICVGAAFDFLSGSKARAPIWYRKHGFEWAFRIYQEPRRLLGRYLEYGPKYIVRIILQLVRQGQGHWHYEAGKTSSSQVHDRSSI